MNAPPRLRITLRLVGAIALLTSLPSVTLTATAEPTREELLAQIHELQARVDQLEAARNVKAADTQAVESAKANVLRDAERRGAPSTLAPTAGYDKDGFYLRGDDNAFTLRPSVLLHFRYVASHVSEGSAGDAETESGFELRRVHLSLDGSAVTPKLIYKFKWAVDRNSGNTVLEDGFVNYAFTPRWSLTLGQFRDPLTREEIVAVRNQLAADRSLANALFGGPAQYVQGLMLVYGGADDALHAAFAAHDGEASANTPFYDAVSGGVGFVEHFGFTGRVDYKFFGDWRDYRDFTARETKRPLLVAGAAADWTQGDGADALFLTADAQYETPGGFNAFAALLGRSLDLRDEPDGSRFDWGALIQAGQMIGPAWELFARYDVFAFDVPIEPGDADLTQEITLGLNRYLGEGGRLGQRARLTFDLTYLPDGCPVNATGLGVLESDGDEWVLRAQLQLIL